MHSKLCDPPPSCSSTHAPPPTLCFALWNEGNGYCDQENNNELCGAILEKFGGCLSYAPYVVRLEVKRVVGVAPSSSQCHAMAPPPPSFYNERTQSFIVDLAALETFSPRLKGSKSG